METTYLTAVRHHGSPWKQGVLARERVHGKAQNKEQSPGFHKRLLVSKVDNDLAHGARLVFVDFNDALTAICEST